MSSHKCSLILLVIVAVLALGALAKKPEKIIGGQYALEGEFPYIVSLRFMGKYHVCGGSIISEYHVLTAAHCIESGSTAEDYSVATGMIYLWEPRARYQVRRLGVHPDWNDQTIQNDIAVLTLDEAIIFNSLINRIALSTTPPREINGYRAVVAGWGRTTSNNPKSASKNLKKLNLKVIDSQECSEYLTDLYSDTQVCGLNYPGTDSCQGDSGGPLVVKEELVGIVSYGNVVNNVSCANGTPGVYTSIYHYNEFILREMRLLFG